MLERGTCTRTHIKGNCLRIALTLSSKKTISIIVTSVREEGEMIGAT